MATKVNFNYNRNMFNSLTGIITGKFPKQVFIDTNGVEWDLCVPDSNLDMLPPVGNEAKIYTYLQHTDQLMSLYGFASADERSVFLDLLKVDGVGPKGAVKIMSAVSSARMLDVLEKGEKVEIKGKGTNKTDITVSLHEITDISSQTVFENCVADVNIPVGEVFTTPVLKGTDGVLHVSRVFLNELEYLSCIDK